MNPDLLKSQITLLGRPDDPELDHKSVNLLMCAMFTEKVDRVTIDGNPSRCRVVAQRRGEELEVEEWTPLPIGFDAVWRRLTVMANPPNRWWNRCLFWYRLPSEFTARLDRWFWHPSFQDMGKFELNFNNATYWATFERTADDRIELSYSLG